MKRYIALVSSVIMLVCLGGIYAWSVFVQPLERDFGMSPVQTQIIFGAIFASFTLTMLASGALLRGFDPRVICLAGGIVFGGGFLVAAASGGAFGQTLAGVGIMCGIGVGMCYVWPLTLLVRWFPEAKGAVTGIAVAGFGSGAVLLSQIADRLLLAGHSVLDVFHITGIAYGIAIIASSLLLFSPEDAGVDSRGVRRASVGEIIAQADFRRLCAGMFCGTFAGLLVCGNIKPMGLQSGFSAEAATLAVGAFSLGNAAGRISWGFICDRIGERSVRMSLICAGISMLVLLASVKSGIAFSAATFIVGFGFGANFVVYAARVADVYGAEAVATAYPFVFLLYGFSGVMGPLTGGWMFGRTGSYVAPVIIGALIAFAGLAAFRPIAERIGIPAKASEEI